MSLTYISIHLLCATPSFYPSLTPIPYDLQASVRGTAVSSRPVAPVRLARGQLQVRAARIGGVEIPNAKRLETSLTYVFGIGPTTAAAIVRDCKFEHNPRVGEMSEDEINVVRAEVDKYMTEGDLRRFNSLNIKRLTEIGCYRGLRHIASLPLRGQRTKTNARTRKGKRKTVAGKKILKK